MSDITGVTGLRILRDIVAGRTDPHTLAQHRDDRCHASEAAILVYRTLKEGLVYADPGAAEYDARDRTRVLRRLRQRAENLGFTLVDLKTGELAEGAAS